MAYITANQTRDIKKRLRSAFPGFKFSVRNRHHMSVSVKILSGPRDFSDLNLTNEWVSHFDPTHFNVNHYHLHNYGPHEGFFRKIAAIVNEGNYDNSDIMTDYFDVGFYVSISVGSWDRPYVPTLELA